MPCAFQGKNGRIMAPWDGLTKSCFVQDFIVDGDEDDEDIGRKQPAKKGRRGGLVISDDEDD